MLRMSNDEEALASRGLEESGEQFSGLDAPRQVPAKVALPLDGPSSGGSTPTELVERSHLTQTPRSRGGRSMAGTICTGLPAAKVARDLHGTLHGYRPLLAGSLWPNWVQGLSKPHMKGRP